MTDSVEAVNRALEQMGERPLGPSDVVQTDFVEETRRVDPDDDSSGTIKLVEPPGYKRSHIFFMNGREVLVDMQLAELIAAVRDFMADTSRDFLELPHIELVGGQQGPQQGDVVGGVVVGTPTLFSRKAMELVQSMGVSYAKRVPGEEQPGGKGKVAIVRGDDAAKSVIVQMNREERRRLRGGR